MHAQLAAALSAVFDDGLPIEVSGLDALPGGFSRETFMFDATTIDGDTSKTRPMILRKDPPPSVAILETSRLVEHNLLEGLRAHTNLPVSRSYCVEMDPAVFGEQAIRDLVDLARDDLQKRLATVLERDRERFSELTAGQDLAELAAELRDHATLVSETATLIDPA